MHERTRPATLVIAIVGTTLAACDDSSTAPDPMDNQAPAAHPELAISVDEVLAETALWTADAALGSLRDATEDARLVEAREHFADARRRWAAGDAPGALEYGRLARRAIAEALVWRGGTRVVDDMIDESEALITTLAVSDAGYADADMLSATLEGFVAQARKAREAGSDLGAAERMVSARQHTDRAARDWHRDSHRSDWRHDVLGRRILAHLQVAQGAYAIRLAWALVGDALSEAQARLLEAAKRLENRAEEALAAGRPGLAASLAHSAEIRALRAVVVAADGLSHDGVRSVATLAARLLEEARAVVASDGSAVDRAILEIAALLYERGERLLASGNARGVVLLWHSATMSEVLIGT